MKNIGIIITFLTILLATIFLGNIWSRSGLAWYRTLTLPNYTPANWVFPVAWTIIYILASCSVIVLLQKDIPPDKFTTIRNYFFINILAHAAWSYLFFKKHSIMLSFIDCILIFSSTAILIYTIWPYSKYAAILLAPYALWTFFAAILNLHILLLNNLNL